MDIDHLLSSMTLQEKAALVTGTDFMYTNEIPRLRIPRLSMSDGPHGLRKQTGTGDNGVSSSEPATAFPTAAATASGWDPELLYRMGEAIAEECRYYGVHTLLGPGVNLKRNPLCGRNFEYFSEDPLLAGVMGAAMVNGVQSKGVGVSVKHFALNNSENRRFMGNSVAGERTMRTRYLKPFEYIVKHARPATIMCAYNQINGTFCSENEWLLTDVLRKEWGFDGVVMSDWGAVRDRVQGLKAGLDLEMPGDNDMSRRRILDAIEDGVLPEARLDDACRNILRWIDRFVQEPSAEPVDWDAHHRLAGEIASQCAVLMKNDGTLPLSAGEKLHIAGPLFQKMRYQGAGSSMIRPTRVTTPADAFREHGIGSVPLEDCDKVLYFGGLTDEYESEGSDREHMRLPEDQLREIEALLASGKRIVIVLFGGSPVELPFCDDVNAILNMVLPGQNGGSAVCDLLFGTKNPSGKLSETWPLRYEDVPGAEEFGKHLNEVYREGPDIGYRYYQSRSIPVRFPFGFGLSYTTFSQGEWTCTENVYETDVTNMGDRAGAEVVMLFLEGELKGFQKVFLEPGETKRVSIAVEEEPSQEYPDDYVVPDEPPALPITLESPFTDYRQTFFGRILYGAVMSVPKNQLKKAKRMADGPEKDNQIKGAEFIEKVLASNSARSLSMSSGGALPYPVAEGFVELANGHVLKAIRCFTRKIKVPALPKEEKKP